MWYTARRQHEHSKPAHHGSPYHDARGGVCMHAAHERIGEPEQTSKTRVSARLGTQGCEARTGQLRTFRHGVPSRLRIVGAITPNVSSSDTRPRIAGRYADETAHSKSLTRYGVLLSSSRTTFELERHGMK